MKNQKQPLSEEKLAHFAKGTPAKQGLYDPQFERDACGVGFIANMDGRQSHQIIFDALNILVKLTHRGACSCDNRTGDGAGLLLQIPDTFCRKVTADMGFELPEKGCYGTGLVFLPKDETARKWIKEQFEEKVASNGHKFLGWRELPVDRSVLGEVAARTEPHMEQIFIASCSSSAKAPRKRWPSPT